MRKKLVAGNWKMHGSLQQNAALLEALVAAGDQPAEVVVFPPFPYLAQASGILSGSAVALGAQNLSEHAVGAYTGEVSAQMLCDVGCRYVLVGHSERRAYYGETDELVADKFMSAQSMGLVPVLCVGETREEREAGDTAPVVLRQLAAVIAKAGVRALNDAVLAYEPVWAIGTGLTATPGQAQEVHAVIRNYVATLDPLVAVGVRVLYGGSVKAQNAQELFAQPDVDGGLVGGASLVANEFLAICQAVS